MVGKSVGLGLDVAEADLKGFPLGAKFYDTWDRGWRPKTGTVVKTMKTRVRLRFRSDYDERLKKGGHLRTYDRWHAVRFLRRID